jgi:hypothetical protein
MVIVWLLGLAYIASVVLLVKNLAWKNTSFGLVSVVFCPIFIWLPLTG